MKMSVDKRNVGDFVFSFKWNQRYFVSQWEMWLVRLEQIYLRGLERVCGFWGCKKWLGQVKSQNHSNPHHHKKTHNLALSYYCIIYHTQYTTLFYFIDFLLIYCVCELGVCSVTYLCVCDWDRVLINLRLCHFDAHWIFVFLSFIICFYVILMIASCSPQLICGDIVVLLIDLTWFTAILFYFNSISSFIWQFFNLCVYYLFLGCPKDCIVFRTAGMWG